MLPKADLALRIIMGGALALSAGIAFGQLQVTTYHNDNLHTGLNPNESILTTANVNSSQFGLLFSLPVDGQVYAQPLYLQGIAIPGKGVHNVLFVATEHNSVYAFDADSNSGNNASPLWHVNLGTPRTTGLLDTHDVAPLEGITSTPVIHTLKSGVQALYVSSLSIGPNGHGSSVSTQRIHVLSVATGAELLNGPFVVSGEVPGTGDGSLHGMVAFNPSIQNGRASLLIVANKLGSTLYACFGSHSDGGPYHGWMFVYDAELMMPMGVFNTTPNAVTDAIGGLDAPRAGGGIWGGGAGPISDGSSVFFSTGNGKFNPANQSYGDSILRIPVRTVSVIDYFTPFDQETLEDYDTDLGSGGAMLIPPSSSGTGNMKLLLQCGKGGTVHLIDTTNMGKYNTVDNIVQELPGATGGVWGVGAYFNNTVFLGPIYSSMVSYTLKGGHFTSTAPNSYTALRYQYPGPTPSVSSNGLTNGIVWAIQAGGWWENAPATLQAYDARNLAVTLYDSSTTNGRDTLDGAVKFTTPTVINGKVYIGCSSSVCVLGLGAWAATPVVTPRSGIYAGSVTVTAEDSSPGATIRYTTDGTLPTQSSPIYMEPVTLNAGATFSARAFAPGLGASAVAVSKYVVK